MLDTLDRAMEKAFGRYISWIFETFGVWGWKSHIGYLLFMLTVMLPIIIALNLLVYWLTIPIFRRL